MQVLDDGSHVQLAPDRRFHGAVAQLVQPERLSRLTQEQAEVLAVVIMEGMATRRRIEEVRGAAQLSIGAKGPVSLPRDSSETLALLLSRGLLCAERDYYATGRPLAGLPATGEDGLLRSPLQADRLGVDRDRLLDRRGQRPLALLAPLAGVAVEAASRSRSHQRRFRASLRRRPVSR